MVRLATKTRGHVSASATIMTAILGIIVSGVTYLAGYTEVTYPVILGLIILLAKEGMTYYSTQNATTTPSPPGGGP